MPVTLNLAGLPWYEVENFRDWGVDAAISTRAGGVSSAPYDTLNLGEHVGDDPRSVAENRRRVASAMGVAPTRLVIARQVHGAVVNDVDHWEGDALVGDALVTTRDDVALAVLVADCVPLLVVDPHGPRFALVHAGWRGLEAGILRAVIDRFDAPEQLRVLVGPHVSPERYQVGPEVAQHFVDVPGACLEDQDDRRRRLDLQAVAVHQLACLGLLREHVTTTSNYTDETGVFFSDRAQRPCGRFALLARRTPVDAARESRAT